MVYACLDVESGLTFNRKDFKVTGFDPKNTND